MLLHSFQNYDYVSYSIELLYHNFSLTPYCLTFKFAVNFFMIIKKHMTNLLAKWTYTLKTFISSPHAGWKNKKHLPLELSIGKIGKETKFVLDTLTLFLFLYFCPCFSRTFCPTTVPVTGPQGCPPLLDTDLSTICPPSLFLLAWLLTPSLIALEPQS